MMVIALKLGITEKGIQYVVKKIKELGFISHIYRDDKRVIIGVVGENTIRFRKVFETISIVKSVMPISQSYMLVNRKFKKRNTIVKVRDVRIGGEEVVVIAGPCAVENEDQLLEIAQEVKEAGAKVLRGGAFKLRTSPYSFHGLGKKGLKYLAEVSRIVHLPVVTEVINPSQIELVARYVDIIQVGARNMQNSDLLREVGRSKKPVLLKKGMASTLKEFLMSAEYILSSGNCNVILCERGIRTFEDATRFTLDLSAVSLIKELSHLPIITDPSHATGKRSLVVSMSNAAIAAGSDGLMIEVHSRPEEALSDGPQSLTPLDFRRLMKQVKSIAKALGRRIS